MMWQRYSGLFILAVFLPLLLSSCAPPPQNIGSTYVSSSVYGSYNCRQIRSEMMRIARRVYELTGVQTRQAQMDMATVGIGLVMFWPAALFALNEDSSEELANLKGQYEALERTALEKDCDVSKEIEAARQMHESRQEAFIPLPKIRAVNE